MAYCADWPDAGSDDSPGIRPAEIFQEYVVVRLDRESLACRRVCIGHQKDSLFRMMNLSVDGIKTVYYEFQLCRKAKVVHRRSEDHAIGIDDMLADKLEVIIEYAGADRKSTR